MRILYLKPYLALFRIRFTNTLQYRAAALAGMTTQFAWGFMYILAFAAFYRSNPYNFPMEFSHTVSYIWLQQAFIALFFMWFYDNNIIESIETGSIAYELVRPMDLYSRWFTITAATRLARTMLRAVPLLIVAFVLPGVFGMRLPLNAVQFGMFMLSMVLALGVVLTFSMLIYISLFYTINGQGIRLVVAVAADFLSGAAIPLPFFPDRIRMVVELLPFGSMQNMPLLIYVGHVYGAAAWRGIGLQVFWLVVLLGIGRFWMGRALSKVVVQGG